MVPARLEGEFCAVLNILAQSERHRTYTVAGLERLVAPALENNQYFLQDGIYISWAFLSDEAQDGFMDGSRKIQPSDWNSGPHAWVIDVATTGPQNLLPIFRRLRKQNGTKSVQFRRWYPELGAES